MGDYEERNRFEVVRLWECDGEEVLRLNRAVLLPWVPQMRHSRATIFEAVRRVRQSNDPNLLAEFSIQGGLHYGKRQWTALLEEVDSMTTLEDFRLSSVTRDMYREATEKGLAQGIVKGRLETLRGIVEKQVTKRFPELAPRLALDSVKDPNVLDTLFNDLIDASTAEQARQALSKARLLRPSAPRRRTS